MVLDGSRELPARLAAVCVTAADGSRNFRLRDVVQLLATAGPVYHALQSYSAAGEVILVFFEDHQSAQQATSAFHLAHLDATSRLHVQLADKQQLHGLLQLLARASQTAGLISADVRAPGAAAAAAAHLPSAAPPLSLAALQPGWAQPSATQPALSQPFGAPAAAAAAAEKQRATRQLAAAAAAAWGVQAPSAASNFGAPGGGLHLLSQLPPASLHDEPSLLAPASPVATSNSSGGQVAAAPGAVGGSSGLGLSWSSSSLQGLSAAAGAAAANGYGSLAPTDRGLLGSSIGSSGSGSLQQAALAPSGLRASPPPLLPGFWQQEQPAQQQQGVHRSFELERVPTPTQRAAAAAPAAWQQQQQQQQAQGEAGWLPAALPSGSAGSQQALLPLSLQGRLPSSSLSHSAASSPHAASFRAAPDGSASGGDADAEMLQLHLCAAALRRQHDEFLAEQAQQAQQRAASPAELVAGTGREGQPQPKQPCWSAVAAAAPPAPAAQQAAGAAPVAEVEHRVLTVPRVPSQHQQRPQPTASGTAGRTAAEAAAPPAGPDEQGWEEVGARHSGAAAALPAAVAPSSSGDTSGGLGRKLYVKHVLQNAKPDQIRAVFGKFGSLEECVKFPEVSYAFVTYRSSAAAAAAFAHLNEETVPSLSGTSPLWIEFRGDAGSSSGGSTPRAGAGGVKAGSGKAGSKGAPAATFEGSIARDPVRCPLPSKKHEGDSESLTTKLWVGGISGDADEGTLKRIFGRFGPVYGIELRPAPEPGRRDQWAFVNFRRTEDSKRAFEELVDRVIPELTGSMRLKLRFKVPLAPSDRGQQGGSGGGGGGKKGKGARH